ncbi:MAG: histidine kinase [Muribaculaceae bacterium]|nr:histidine kinase [Muribaculaceae bacterium]
MEKNETMKLRIKSTKHGEFWVYLLLWLFLFASSLLSMSAHASMDSNIEFRWHDIFHNWISLSFFLGAFLIHNFFITPILFKKHNVKGYLAAVIVLLSVFQSYQCAHRPADMPPPHMVNEMMKSDSAARAENTATIKMPRAPMPKNRPPQKFDQMPVRPPMDVHDIMAFTILLLLLGVNVGVKYFFMSIKRTHEIEELEKKTLEQQLEYLKYQINPHFFMNTLNNIHALVDVNPDKAKSSILELSKLMRYVLYESNNPSVPLQRELEFIRHYIELMRMRYTEKVEIDVNLPADCSSRPIPPLMFISFVENAFKHGVSYVQSSKIKISVEEDEHKVKFMCSNTKASSNGEQGGIGMENSRKRLSLIYKEDYTLQVDEAGDTYDVLLVIPFLDDDIQINN